MKVDIFSNIFSAEINKAINLSRFPSCMKMQALKFRALAKTIYRVRNLSLAVTIA